MFSAGLSLTLKVSTETDQQLARTKGLSAELGSAMIYFNLWFWHGSISWASILL